jgi:hypothetical protein
MSERELIEQVLRRTTTDSVFRATALHDPVAALAQVARENGLTIDADRAEAVTFVKSAPNGGAAGTAETATFVLPDPSAPDELDVAQLEQVAGGCMIDSHEHCGICTIAIEAGW